MQRILLALAGLGMAAGSNPAPAQIAAEQATARNKYESLHDQCMAAPGHSADDVSPAEFNLVLAGCAESASDVAKQDINRLYARLEASLKATARDDVLSRLERTQRAWITYRDGRCELEGTLIGTPAYSLCLLEVNGERVAELEELVR